MQKQQSHPFEPIIFSNSEMLILGSFPSLKSFEYGFYYAHPKNQFWKLLSNIYDKKAESQAEKIELLKYTKIALWDVAKTCERKNSADSNLKNIVPNDIKELLSSYPNIKLIFFTGRTAQKIFNTHFGHLGVSGVLLPSPSPAYAAVSFEAKLEIWRKTLIDSTEDL